MKPKDYFAGIIENVFHSQIGVADAEIVSYLTELLIRFIRTDTIYSLRGIKGNRLYNLTKMLDEADERKGTARKKAYQHVGDYTLFHVGLYPESVPDVAFYMSRGRNSYIETGNSDDENPELFWRLGDEFDLCAYGLNFVKKDFSS